MPADWQEITVNAGATESAEIPMSADDIEVPKGQVHDATGAKMTGTAKPKFDVQSVSDGSCKIVLRAPANQDTVFRYKAVTDDDDGGTP